MKLDLNEAEMAFMLVACGERLDLLRKRIDPDPAELAGAEALKYKLRLSGEEVSRTKENESSTTTAGSTGQRSPTSGVRGGVWSPTGRIRRTSG